MILDNLTNRGATPALIATSTFSETRLRTLSENIANWNVPGYKAKQLDTKGFQQALRKALDDKGSDFKKVLNVRNDQVQTNAGGHLDVKPSEFPSENVLFHDGTNASIENMMTDLADNGMVYEAANTLLRGYFDGMRKAIRGTI